MAPRRGPHALLLLLLLLAQQPPAFHAGPSAAGKPHPNARCGTLCSGGDRAGSGRAPSTGGMSTLRCPRSCLLWAGCLRLSCVLLEASQGSGWDGHVWDAVQG